MGTGKRRRLTAEYKGEAVKRLNKSGKALQRVATGPGVHANQLRTWQNERLVAGFAEALVRQRATAAPLRVLCRTVDCAASGFCAWRRRRPD